MAINPGELTPWSLAYAYRHGAFPMGDETQEIHWYRPYHRALFPLSGIRVSRSLARSLRRGRFEVRFDTAFEPVMRGCLRPEGNWITEPIIQAYCAVHGEGWAHCAECWSEGRLVGGVYGLALGSAFFAESMFHRETDASKVALAALIDRCREMGFEIFDAQVMNPHLASLGAYEVSHAEYMDMLESAIVKPNPWSPGLGSFWVPDPRAGG